MGFAPAIPAPAKDARATGGVTLASWLYQKTIMWAVIRATPISTKAGPASPATQMGPLLPVDSMIVNLDEPGGNRYLKISFSLELEHDLDDARRQLMPRLRDEVLVYLSSFTVEQIQKPQTKLEIKRKLKDLANKVFGQPVAKQVYFKELVMQ